MLGAARCAGVADGTVVAVDLGQSTAKSGLVRMCQGEVSDLHTLRRSEVGFDLSAPVPAEQLETLLDDVLSGRRHGRPRAHCKGRRRCLLPSLLRGRPFRPLRLLGNAGPERGGMDGQAPGLVRQLPEPGSSSRWDRSSLVLGAITGIRERHRYPGNLPRGRLLGLKKGQSDWVNPIPDLPKVQST